MRVCKLAVGEGEGKGRKEVLRPPCDAHARFSSLTPNKEEKERKKGKYSSTYENRSSRKLRWQQMDEHGML